MNITTNQGMFPDGRPTFSQPPVGLLQNPATAQMGPWSQLAYQMAGSPHQGGLWAPVAPPTALPGTGYGSASSGGLSGIGGGLLGTIAKNPGLVKNGYNAISGLLGLNTPNIAGAAAGANQAATQLGAGAAAGQAGVASDVAGQNAAWLASQQGGLLGAGGSAADILAGGSPALSTVGTGAVDAAANSAYANAAGQLGSNSGVLGSGLSGAQALGAVAVPLSLYNEVNNWQSGATGPDALGGAASGAAVGTAIMPGVGTVIGGLLGGAAGALSSAFGPGKVDAENKPFEAYTQAYNKAPVAQQAQLAASVQNPYLPLAGYFDLRSDQLKGSNPIYSTYGRMGEQKFTTDLTNQINQGLAKGTISKMDDPTAIYNKVVSPWVNSLGTWNDSNKSAMQGLLQQMTSQYVNGSYAQNWKSIGGQTPFTTIKPFGS